MNSLPSTRRSFLQHTALVTASSVGLLGGANTVRFSSRVLPWTASGIGTDPDLPALLLRAVDAARDAGAAYADARVTHTRTQSPGWSDGEERAIGVRVLVDGYWGFLASAVWTPDEAVRLARGAVAQARAHRRGHARSVDLGPAPTVQSGEWVMPVTYDPFDIPVAEKLDVMNAFSDYAMNTAVGVGVNWGMDFFRQYKLFASSDGASWAQTIYRSSASFTVSYRGEYHMDLNGGIVGADGLSPAGRGWELVADSRLIDTIPRLIDQAEQARHVTPFDVGRYDVVCSADAMATLLDYTLGSATELDRALGYEANASGTSYLDDPLAMLGEQVVASPLVSITANRSIPGGVATVRWDDEGVASTEFTLVKDGVLVDYQTTREQAAWLASYYQKSNRPVRSHGCANASSALAITMQHAPNLAMTPGHMAVTFDDLVAGTERGIAILSCSPSMDQQGLNGLGSCIMREITHGKLGRYLRGGALMFRAPELWKNVVAIGGPVSQEWFGMGRGKGQPAQSTYHSVGAVPAKIRQLSIIDPGRKA